MRRRDQHISGVSTRYPALCKAVASWSMIVFGEPVFPCIRTMPMVFAEACATSPGNTASITDTANIRLMPASL